MNIVLWAMTRYYSTTKTKPSQTMPSQLATGTQYYIIYDVAATNKEREESICYYYYNYIYNWI